MSDTVTLYVNPLSSFANKCVIALLEKGVAFERKVPASFGTGQTDNDHLLANPFAEVPTLVHNGQSIFESSVIFDYIDTAWPNPPLMPNEPHRRARSLMIQTIMSTRYDPITWGMTELLTLGRVSGEQAAQVRRLAVHQASGINAWLTDQLGHQEWFEGERFGAADVFIAPHLLSAARAQLLPDNGALVSWLERVSLRSSVAEIKLSTESFMGSITPTGLENWKTVPRQYRDHRIEWVVRAAGVEFLAQRLASKSVFLSRDIQVSQ
jgi:glutathione S-transferase